MKIAMTEHNTLREKHTTTAIHVIAHGHVQGVGFRYTTRALSRGFEVAGFVRNLPDGRVQLVVEGEGGEVAAFLEEVQQRLGHFIREVRKDKSVPNGEFLAFEIRH